MSVTTPTYIREDQFLISVSVVGLILPTVYSWQSKEGGDISADVVKARPGGMLGEIALGGMGSRSDVTVKTLYTEDWHSFIPQLEQACGNARMTVSWTPLTYAGSSSSVPGQTTGGTITLTGYLKMVTVPNADANTAGAAQLELQMSCDQFQNGAGF